MIEVASIDKIEIEGCRVTVIHKRGHSMASSTYQTKERAMEVANELWNKKVIHYKNSIQ